MVLTRHSDKCKPVVLSEDIEVAKLYGFLGGHVSMNKPALKLLILANYIEVLQWH